MYRRIALALTLGATTLLATAPLLSSPAVAAKKDAHATSAKTIQKDYKSETKEAEKVFKSAVSALQKSLGNGSTTAEAAATDFSNTLAFYSEKL